jgi:hypothetical protein
MKKVKTITRETTKIWDDLKDLLGINFNDNDVLFCSYLGKVVIAKENDDFINTDMDWNYFIYTEKCLTKYQTRLGLI